MNTDNTTNAVTVGRPEVQFHVHQDEENGSVTATTAVTWTLNQAALEFVARKRDDHPRLLVVVANVVKRLGYDNTTYTRYVPTAVYDVPLLTGKGGVRTPKLFVSFAKPGDNVILGTVFTTRKPAIIAEWVDRPTDLSVLEDEGLLHIETNYAPGVALASEDTASFTTVKVPLEMFAKEPARWRKAVVNLFFRGKASDQCHFRKWFLVSLLLLIPQQLYGLFARLITFLEALIMGRRGTFKRIKALFALHPHDYARQLGTSWWLKDDKGQPRPTYRQVLSPPGLLLWAAILAVSVLPGYAGVTVWNEIRGIEAFPNLWAVWAIGWSFWLCIFVLVVGFTVGYVKVRIAKNTVPPGGFSDELLAAVYEWLMDREARASANAPQAQELKRTEEYMLTRLQAAQSVAYEPKRVPNATVQLKFKALKAAVCKPFAG